MLGYSGMEYLVLTSYLKTLHLFKGGIAPIVVLGVDEDSVVLDGHILVGRTLVLDSFKTIVTVQSRKGQTLPDFLFLGGMDLGCLIRIDEVVGTDK